MTNGISTEPRDIIIAYVNFDDQITIKKRPCLVISKTLFQASSNYIIIAGITSQPSNDPYLMLIENKDLENDLHLRLESRVMCHRIVPILNNTVSSKNWKSNV